MGCGVNMVESFLSFMLFVRDEVAGIEHSSRKCSVLTGKRDKSCGAIEDF